MGWGSTRAGCVPSNDRPTQPPAWDPGRGPLTLAAREVLLFISEGQPRRAGGQTWALLCSCHRHLVAAPSCSPLTTPCAPSSPTCQSPSLPGLPRTLAPQTPCRPSSPAAASEPRRALPCPPHSPEGLPGPGTPLRLWRHGAKRRCSGRKQHVTGSATCPSPVPRPPFPWRPQVLEAEAGWDVTAFGGGLHSRPLQGPQLLPRPP